LEEHPMAAVRLLAVGADVVAQIGGVAQGYGAPPVSVQVISQYIDADGNAAEMPPEPRTIEECDRIIAEYESKHPQPEPLPCDNWSENSPDATPAVEVEQETPPFAEIKRAPNRDIVPGPKVPSRMDMMRILTNDGRGACGEIHANTVGRWW
jgi:hypothetical protein